MRSKSFIDRKMVFGLVLSFVIGCSVQSMYGSSISGTVYDKQRNFVPDVYMELLNETYQSVGRTRTDTTGRYAFFGLSDGYYTIKAMPYGRDLEDQEILVQLVSFSIRGEGQGNTMETRDFYLTPRKGGILESETGVIFAQEIPDTARELYKRALKDFAAKRSQDGVNGLFEAVKIFPDYFDAMFRIGKELAAAGNYAEAWPWFLRSTEINPKSGPSFYYMGVCFHKLGPDYYKAAIIALSQAAVLNPSALQVFYNLGMVERSAGKYEDAEKHLLRAKSLASKPIAEVQKELALLYGDNLKKYKEAADELELYLKAGKMDDKDEKSTKATIQYFREKAKVAGQGNDS